MPKSFEVDVYKSTYPVYCSAGSIDMLSTEGLGWVKLARKCFEVSLVRFLLFSDFCDVTTPEWPRACHIERLLWADNLIVKLLRRSYLPFGPEKAHFTAKKTTTTTKLKSDRSLFRSFYYELSLSFFEQNDHGEEIDLETKRLTTSSLSFFLVRRRKRAIHENDHARDWRRETHSLNLKKKRCCLQCKKASPSWHTYCFLTGIRKSLCYLLFCYYT